MDNAADRVKWFFSSFLILVGRGGLTPARGRELRQGQHVLSSWTNEDTARLRGEIAQRDLDYCGTAAVWQTGGLLLCTQSIDVTYHSSKGILLPTAQQSIVIEFKSIDKRKQNDPIHHRSKV